jgi:hypothetical protein
VMRCAPASEGGKTRQYEHPSDFSATHGPWPRQPIH